MNRDDELTMLPYLWGLAWAMAARDDDAPAREYSGHYFYLAPRLFALIDLARKSPEAYAAAVSEQQQIAAQRYGAPDGDWEGQSRPRDEEMRARLLALLDPGARRVLEAATVISQHWDDQDGFNTYVIDNLRDAVFAWLGKEPRGETSDPPRYGPHALRCCFCGKYGDESTMDPLSGDREACGECADAYQRNPEGLS